MHSTRGATNDTEGYVHSHYMTQEAQQNQDIDYTEHGRCRHGRHAAWRVDLR